MGKRQNYGGGLATSHTNGNEVTGKIGNPILAKVMEERRSRLPLSHDHGSFHLDRILSESRVIIIEGISGSGKDTFQKFLKAKLRGRVVHDYSEGELLWSWKHQQIKEIFKMQIHLMRKFLDYTSMELERDEKAVFLLNRFHLSTYTMYMPKINERSTLEREYNLLIKALRTLPTHVFLLQLMEEEMEARSSHPERGVAWRKFQKQISEREGFANFVNRNSILQKAMIATAIRQKIPFSILRLPSEPTIGVVVRRPPNSKISANLNTALDPSIQMTNLRQLLLHKAV
jgi:thymidylate kinase